jgi:hypothetical protein
MLARGVGTSQPGDEPRVSLSLADPSSLFFSIADSSSLAELKAKVLPAAAEALRSLETLGSLYPQIRPLLPPETWKTDRNPGGEIREDDITQLFGAECRWVLDQADGKKIIRIRQLAGLRRSFEALETLNRAVRRFHDEAIEREGGEILARSRVLTRGIDELIHAAARISKDDADKLAGPAKAHHDEDSAGWSWLRGSRRRLNRALGVQETYHDHLERLQRKGELQLMKVGDKFAIRLFDRARHAAVKARLESMDV